MGNQQSAATAHKPRKYVHWKTAGVPTAPGAPQLLPADEAGAVTLRWSPAADGGAALLGYQVECLQLGGGGGWVRTQPPLVQRPELVLAGLAPPHRYQFRVAALNAVGLSAYSPVSDVLAGAGSVAPAFTRPLQDATVLENETTEFRVEFAGSPPPTVAWFKDGYEIFSSRRTAITTDECSSVLVFHQTLTSDEGEVRCTATNRAGHVVTRARLALEAAPRLRYPRQYEDGLLYEVNETIFLKTTLVGKPAPTIEWRHDGQTLTPGSRVEISTTDKFSVLKIHMAVRSDRGEYQVLASNSIGSDSAAFLVTVTAPPEPPRRVAVARQVDRSVSLAWEPPADDGGCRVGNYIVEYYRSGWDVWLKAVTSRKTTVTLFELIEGSEYRFRVKAESPYGISAPSGESAPVRVPGRAADLQFLAVESRIISQALLREDGSQAEPAVSPTPRRRRAAPPRSTSNEFMLVLYPGDNQAAAEDKAEKRKSFQLDLEDALSPPPISLSAPDLSSRSTFPFKALRNAVSSTELLHERAMARFYKAVAMKEEQSANRDNNQKPNPPKIDIPIYNYDDEEGVDVIVVDKTATTFKAPEIIIKADSFDEKDKKYFSRQTTQSSDASNGKWQHSSFEEDYTASTVSTDGELSDDGSMNGEIRNEYGYEDETYSPRDKMIRPSPVKDNVVEDEEEEITAKPISLPDPNFVPKPILKRRDSDKTEPKSAPEPVPNILKKEEKPKKEEKMTLLKKITKMPSQKPFTFTKILKKVEPPKELPPAPKELPKSTPIPDESEKYGDERTVIDYYSNIVKEYGNQKKPAAQLYLNTDDLKNVAEKQQHEKDVSIASKVKKKQNDKTVTNNIKVTQAKGKTTNTVKKQVKPKKTKEKTDNSDEKNKDLDFKKCENHNDEKCTQKILLRKTERATIVIPIDYQGLEEKAKVNVRTAIDYTVDLCLLLLSFWLYFFKDERLAIPFLILIIYRQLQETLLMNIPQWVRRHTPDWVKKKIS